MPFTADYAARIRTLEWDGLRELWARIAAGHTPGWPAGRALEHLVLRAFELDGAAVRWPFVVTMEDEPVEQIDGAIYAAGLSCIVETKDTVAAVDVAALAKLRSQLARRPAGVVGLFFSRGGFTHAAAALAGYFAPQTMLLWSGREITYILHTEAPIDALLHRYRLSVEEGVAWLGNRTVSVTR
jgi:hypothetical protein